MFNLPSKTISVQDIWANFLSSSYVMLLRWVSWKVSGNIRLIETYGSSGSWIWPKNWHWDNPCLRFREHACCLQKSRFEIRHVGCERLINVLGFLAKYRIILYYVRVYNMPTPGRVGKACQVKVLQHNSHNEIWLSTTFNNLQ